MRFARLRRLAVPAVLLLCLLVAVERVAAYISQVDGTPLPQTGRLQACLDRPGTGETVAGAVNAIVDAAILPEAFRPVEEPPGSGNYPVQFLMLGEGAGYRNLFGYYWTDEDPSVPANLHMIFDCRPGAAPFATSCACPCDPASMRPDDGTTLAWRRTINFETVPGFAPGRAIGFWIRTPEQLDGTSDNDHCGGPAAGNQDHRTYFTSKALNDDGDYVHYLIYESATHTNNYYIGFEDLFRGGDNDFEDVLVRSDGLVPLCVPMLESCNARDDDCDMLVDEGVTMPCSTACGAGMRTCVAGAFGMCSARTPGGEGCNNTDDDCDGSVDEGLSRACTSICGSGTEVCRMGAFVDCTAPTPAIETCNDRDDDCDGTVDEGISRACFSACGSGTETCVRGAFVGCTAPSPGAESCNGMDDDCDGRTDEGLTRPCMTDCGTGTETCISGMFVGCSAPAPGLEACNNVDDDCDGAVDEDLERTCATACGPGTERCMAGAWVDCDAPTPMTEICNNVDDDCDGVIDDGNPGGGESCLPTEDGGYIVVEPGSGGGDSCIPGRVQCVRGMLTCTGASSPTREICNCEDDDCDGLVDESAGSGICPGGACIDCTCVSPCADEEFPCPPGRECDRSLADPEMGIIGYCVPGMCAGVECDDEEEVCNPATGMCQNLCTGVTCGPGFACIRGSCVEDNCYGRGCPAGERCRMGVCEPDPCEDMTCGAGTFCRDGACISVCDETCAPGESCRDGACMADPCGGACSAMQSCVGGECVTDDCGRGCGFGRVCRGTECVDDECVDIDCPAASSCVRGECIADDLPPRVEEPRRGLAAGGGGATCSAGGTPDGSWLAVFFVLCGLLVGRIRNRRQATGDRQRGNVARRRWPVACCLLPILLFGGGCDTDPYCFMFCGEDAGVDAGDAGMGEGGVVPDGCVPAGEEVCNEQDDDCNGVVDDGFDTQRDPRHCGECGNECVLPHAFPTCELGMCAISRCEIGWVDLDESATTGCEYECLNSGDEICDELDNDCDGDTDEGFDLTMELGHCGECNNVCSFPGAMARCEASACVMGDCLPGFIDLDEMPETGCELRCTPTGDERCNGVDDDCDGDTDEGFDTMTDEMHCGVCGRVCSFPRSTPLCDMGVCRINSCDPGFLDLDMDPATGCEYMCTPMAGVDDCDGRDDDCDGAVDEADPMVGTACGTGTGACEPGIRGCEFGRLACLGDRGPTPETCNTIDDDCDGPVDESTAAAPIPGIGARCGPTDVGACEYGSVVCTTGALVCGGALRGPTGETCNGIDDDCDGTADDSPALPPVPPASCVETRGVCAGRVATCRGAAGWACDFPATYQAVETICDARDNDCDGMQDEGCLLATPSSDRRVDTGEAVGLSNSVQPFVSADDANIVYATWMDRRLVPTRLYVNRSTDRGNTWGAAATRVDSGGGASIGPRLAVTGAARDRVATVWSDFRGGTSYREIWSRFSNNALSGFFAADARLNPGQNVDSFGIDVAVAGANVYAVYEVFTTTRTRHIFLVRSANNGQTWSAPVQVDHGAGTSFVAATAQVAAVGANVFVVWRDNRNGALDIFFNRSIDSGASFAATDTRLDVGTVAGSSSSFAPTIAAEGTNVYVAWVDDRSGASFDIWLNRSRNSGATWLTADSIELDRDPLRHDSIEPQVVTTVASEAVVAWIDYRSGFPDVLAVRTTDAGGTFSVPVRLDTGSPAGASGAFDLALSANGNLVAAAWADDRSGLLDIYANFSLDGGANFQPADYRMDSTAVAGSSDSEAPSVYAAPDAVHVLWVDHRDGANGDIYYRRLD